MKTQEKVGLDYRSLFCITVPYEIYIYCRYKGKLQREILLPVHRALCNLRVWLGGDSKPPAYQIQHIILMNSEIWVSSWNVLLWQSCL